MSIRSTNEGKHTKVWQRKEKHIANERKLPNVLCKQENIQEVDSKEKVFTSTPIGYSMSIFSVMANHYIKPQEFIKSQKIVEPIKQSKPKPTN